MNKKAATFGGLTEVMILIVLIISASALIINSLNSDYNQNQDASFGVGLKNESDSLTNSLKNYQTSFESAVNEGEIDYTSVFGLVLKSSYSLLKTTMTMLWTIVSGNIIRKAVMLMQMPAILGSIFQLLYLITIGYILLKILFRTKA